MENDMSEIEIKSGFANVNGAKIYYEMAGEGDPFVMIHAGVADSRQWNNEFAHFSQHYRVIRYDMRGYGKSEPVEGEYSLLGDLVGVLDRLQIEEPLIVMGCSMGGALAIDFALANPSRCKALVLVGSAVGGLELDVPEVAKFAEVEKAYENKDWDLIAELSTQIWFDGMGRKPDQVNPAMRKLAYEMSRLALTYESKGLGKELPDTEPPAAERLSELQLPILAIVGDNDIPYMLAAVDYMAERIPSVRKVIVEDAAHLPNMDHPDEFREIVTVFLNELAG
jgi:pimeloyl-ACP methyl ester carboxylesterase